MVSGPTTPRPCKPFWNASSRVSQASLIRDSVAHGARSVEDLLNARGKQFGRKIADSQKASVRLREHLDLSSPDRSLSDIGRTWNSLYRGKRSSGSES